MTSSTSSSDHESALFENALDSLNHAVNFYISRKANPTAIKHAILLLYQSIELFLKVRLCKVHHILIYENIDRHPHAGSRTVGLQKAVARLENLGTGVTEEDFKVAKELQSRRNHIQHYRFDDDQNHDLTVGHAISFLIEFLHGQLGVELRDLIEEDESYRELLEASMSYQERLSHARREANEKRDLPVGCPECGEETLVVTSRSTPYCYFCHEYQDVEECPSCGSFVREGDLAGVGMCERCLDLRWDL